MEHANTTYVTFEKKNFTINFLSQSSSLLHASAYTAACLDTLPLRLPDDTTW